MLTVGVRTHAIKLGAMDVDDNSSDEFQQYNNNLDDFSTVECCVKADQYRNRSDNTNMAEATSAQDRKPDCDTFIADFFGGFAGLFDQPDETQFTMSKNCQVSSNGTVTTNDVKCEGDADFLRDFNLFGATDSEDEIQETSSKARMLKHNKKMKKREQAEAKARACAEKQTGKSKTKLKHTNTNKSATGAQSQPNSMDRSEIVVVKPGDIVSNKTISAADHCSSTAVDDDDFCCICLDQFNEPRELHKCSHKFCSDCIEQQFQVKPVCPVCFVAYGVVTGTQPEGHMHHRVNKTRLPGYEDTDCIIVSYSFDNGIQTEEHPHPGVPYSGTSRSGYLPNNAEGQKVLRLLKEAFKRRLVFTVGRSRTTGCDNVVTWNDIHHKTSPSGGQEAFGYPDPTYLQRVQEELAAFGVTEESLKETNG